MIYDNKTAIISFAQEIFGVIIESKEMSDTNRAIFEMAWGFAGLVKYKKTIWIVYFITTIANRHLPLPPH